MRDLLRPLLPSGFGVGSGEVVSASNLHSSQEDVVIYSRSILPPLLHEETTGLFPVESVLYTIEIKSNLTRAELRRSHDSARQLQAMPYLYGKYDEFGQPIPHPVKPVISAILAFGTNLGRSKTIVEHYDKLREPGDPAIRVICVAGMGYWYWYIDRWEAWPLRYPFEEMVGFVGGVMNSLVEVSSTRGYPRLGQYILS